MTTPKGKSKLQIKDKPNSHKNELLNKTAKHPDKILKIITKPKVQKKSKKEENKEREEKIKKEKEEKQK